MFFGLYFFFFCVYYLFIGGLYYFFHVQNARFEVKWTPMLALELLFCVLMFLPLFFWVHCVTAEKPTQENKDANLQVGLALIAFWAIVAGLYLSI